MGSTAPPSPAIAKYVKATAAAVSKAAAGSSKNASLFEPLHLGALRLSHRVVMAPLTRTRGTDRYVPAPTAAEYYGQRATPGGLLITEAIPISPETVYEYAPGIYTPEQEAAWKNVVDAVHARGGLISAQLWHLGRAIHDSWGNDPFLKSLGRALPTVSSSAVAIPKGTATEFGTGKQVPCTVPRALEAKEIATRLVDDYRRAAQAAKRVGFDAIEIHAAHGYLLNQFLCDGVNKRTDEYGGSIENRVRVVHQVLDAVIEVMGADRVGIRVSPTYKDTFTYYQCADSNPEALYREVVRSLNRFGLAYLLLSEPRWTGGKQNSDPRTDSGFLQGLRHPAWMREVYHGPIIGAGGFTPSTAAAAVKHKPGYDAVAFGRWFISNPDFVYRLATDAPLNIYHRPSFYIRDPVKGYVDYPALPEHRDIAPHGVSDNTVYGTMLQQDIGTVLEGGDKKPASHL